MRDERKKPRELGPYAAKVAAEVERRKGDWRRQRWQSGPAPYGYRWSGIRGQRTLEVDQSNAPVVRRIFATYVDMFDASAWKIADALTSECVPSPRNKRVWSAQSVVAILKNVAYCGRVKFGNVERAGVHQALVPAETFDEAAI